MSLPQETASSNQQLRAPHIRDLHAVDGSAHRATCALDQSVVDRRTNFETQTKGRALHVFVLCFVFFLSFFSMAKTFGKTSFAFCTERDAKSTSRFARSLGPLHGRSLPSTAWMGARWPIKRLDRQGAMARMRFAFVLPQCMVGMMNKPVSEA